MKIALGIVQLFPEGGLQRDCIRLANLLAERGHSVTVFTSEFRGPVRLPDCRLEIIPVRALTNHGVDLGFARKFRAATADGYDRVVGFNKLLDLQFYYCADPSVRLRDRNVIERLLPRHRMRTMLEGQSFGPFQRTKIFALTQASADSYRRIWGTQRQRICVLQPSIDPTRQRPELRTPANRAAFRTALGIPPGAQLWLWIGAQTYVKGLDRVLKALASQPDALLLAAGIEPDARNSRLIPRRRDKSPWDRVRVFGVRDDIPELMAAADMLIHPSRLDVTGQAILESVVNGLPVVVSGACGFAEHVEAAKAGIVLPEPFSQSDLNAAVARLQDQALRERMSESGIEYGRAHVSESGLMQAATHIEQGTFSPPPARDTQHAGGPAMPSVRSHNSISVIVTTYNRPDALDAVLRSLARQRDTGFEVIVADDGSLPATAELVDSWRSRLGRPLLHVWHEDRGFRAAEIRNRAILASSGCYCIFLDGDCITRDSFVDAHRRLAELGWFVIGNRALMSERLTTRVLANRVEAETWGIGDIAREWLHGGINRVAPLLPLRLGPLRKALSYHWLGARSCNLGVWRADLDRVDGFDARFVGWGLEDSDLLIRLLHAGVRRKDGRFATGVYHLWHPFSDRSHLPSNSTLLDVARNSDRIRAVQGLSSLRAQDQPAASADRFAGVRRAAV